MSTLKTYLNVFPPDGWNKESGDLNGVHASSSRTRTEQSLFLTNNLTLAAVFLGLPHRMLEPNHTQSMRNLVKNFFGWRDTVSTFKNVITMPLMITMNIVLTPLKLFINITKVATEFLPQLVEEKLDDVSNFFYTAGERRTGVQRISLIAASGLIYLLSLCVSVIYVLGRALTSPNISARIAFSIGANFGNRLMGSPGPTLLGASLGLIASLVSLSFSIALYTLILPLGLQLIGANVLPHLPGAISGFIDGIGSALAPFFKVMAGITKAFAFEIVAGAVAGYSNAAIAIAGLTAIATTVFGYLARDLSSQFKIWWHKPSAELMVSSKPHIAEEEEDTRLDDEEEEEEELSEDDENDEDSEYQAANARDKAFMIEHTRRAALIARQDRMVRNAANSFSAANPVTAVSTRKYSTHFDLSKLTDPNGSTASSANSSRTSSPDLDGVSHSGSPVVSNLDGSPSRLSTAGSEPDVAFTLGQTTERPVTPLRQASIFPPAASAGATQVDGDLQIPLQQPLQRKQ